MREQRTGPLNAMKSSVRSQPDFFASDQHGRLSVDTRRIHPHSVESFHAIDATLGDRQLAVLRVYQSSSSPLTDRQCLDRIAPGSSDLNRVRPRITELVEMGLLRQVGSCTDVTTGRRVRTCGASACGEVRKT